MLFFEQVSHKLMILLSRHHVNILRYEIKSWSHLCYICWDTRSLSNQTPTALLTNALVVWLYNHFIGKITTLSSLLGSNCWFSVYTDNKCIFSIKFIKYVTNFIQPYLHQFFDNSHSLNCYGKPLKRPFNRYQSRLKAISIGWDIRQINW